MVGALHAAAVYRLLMLAWALWLAQALLRWLRWGWESFGAGGLLARAPQAERVMRQWAMLARA